MGIELQVGRHAHLVLPLMKRGGRDRVDTLQVGKVDMHTSLYPS